MGGDRMGRWKEPPARQRPSLPPGEGIKVLSGHPGRGVPTGIFFVAVETWCRAHRRAVGLPPPLGLLVLRTLYHPTFYTGITA